MNGKDGLPCPVCRETLDIKIGTLPGIENEPEDKSDAVGIYTCSVCSFIFVNL